MSLGKWTVLADTSGYCLRSHRTGHRLGDLLFTRLDDSLLPEQRSINLAVLVHPSVELSRKLSAEITRGR